MWDLQEADLCPQNRLSLETIRRHKEEKQHVDCDDEEVGGEKNSAEVISAVGGL